MLRLTCANATRRQAAPSSTSLARRNAYDAALTRAEYGSRSNSVSVKAKWIKAVRRHCALPLMTRTGDEGLPQHESATFPLAHSDDAQRTLSARRRSRTCAEEVRNRGSLRRLTVAAFVSGGKLTKVRIRCRWPR